MTKFFTSIRIRQFYVACVLLSIFIIFLLGYLQLDFTSTQQKRNKHVEIDSAVSAKEFQYISQLEQEDPTETDFVDTSIARALKKKVRILCLILTTERFFNTRVRVLNATWVRRCNDHYFIVNSKTSLPKTIVIDKPDTRENLVYKSQTAFIFTYDNLIDTFDWILRADDDTYMVMENLRFLLSNYDPNEPSYMGFHFNRFVKDHGYMSGGAGYVISNKGIRHLVERGFKVHGACALSKGSEVYELSEDVEIGKCLKAAGVQVMSSIDKGNRESFHPYPLSQYLLENLPGYLLEWANNKQETGINCCSPFSISFHYCNPSSMLLMDHLLYRTSVFGRRLDDTITGNDVFQIGPVTNMAQPGVDLEKIKEGKDKE